MKVSGLLVAVAAGVLGFSALSAQAAPVALNLTLQVDQVAHSWQVFGQITGDTTRTQGLAGVQYNVAGVGAVVVDSSINDLPASFASFSIGFTQFTSDGTNGLGMSGAQSTTAYKSGTGANTGKNNVITGVGLNAGPQFGVAWSLPVLMGEGTYTGSAGALTVQGSPTLTTFLPATMPTPTSAGVGVGTFSPDAVNGATVQIGARITPEPASLGLLGLGSLLVLRRRRSA